MKPPLTDQEATSIWRDAIERMREEAPQLHAKWKKLKPQRTLDTEIIKWEEVEFMSGMTDGDQMTINLRIRGVLITIEGTDIEMCSPAWIHRKMRLYTCADIEFPFDKKDPDTWVAGGLLVWLRNERTQKAERKTNESIIIDSLRAFCEEPISAESEPDAWGATSKAIYEQGIYYISFAGFMSFIRRSTGSDHKKLLTNVLTGMSMDGDSIRKYTKHGRVRFYRINKDTLYVTQPDSSDAWGGEDYDARTESEGAATGWEHGLDDILWEKERRENESRRGDIVEGG